MSVKIKPISDHESYEINGHVMSKDRNGNWNCESILSIKELAAFNQYENLIIKNNRFKKHIRAVYRGQVSSNI